MSCFIIQVAFLLFRATAFLFKAKNTKNIPVQNNKPFSILVAAKNEYHNLQELIPLLLQQEGDTFEIIIADDCSTDQSIELLKSYANKHTNFHYIPIATVPNGINSKKHALSLAIEKANYENLVFTDADCIPSSNKWAKIISSHLTYGTDIVLGISPYIKKKGLLNSCIRLETMATAINYSSFALWQIPYMGVGRNLGYKKSLFLSHDGFSEIAHITGGDDDLLIQKLANQSNTFCCLEKESFCLSKPKQKWLNWLKQKKRHYSVSKFYALFFKLILGLDASSKLFLIYSFFIHVIFSNIRIEMMTLFLLGLLLAPTVIYVMSNKLGFKTSFLDIFFLLPLTNFILAGVSGLSFFLKQSSKWN